jgi:uncharacterized protein (TIGR00369 family)
MGFSLAFLFRLRAAATYAAGKDAIKEKVPSREPSRPPETTGRPLERTGTRGFTCLEQVGTLGYAATMPTDPSSPPRRYALASLFGPGKGDMVSTPHGAYLGLRVIEIGPGFGVCALPFREELVGDPRRRVIFGGAITTLIDHASGLAVACAVEELTAIATIDLRVDYLRAAEPDRELYARSDCYRLTRAVAFCRAVAWERSPDDPFASALGTFMLGANRTNNTYARLLGRKDRGQ